jgi:hypothetical protein
MKLEFAAVIGFGLTAALSVSPSFSQSVTVEPTRQEIARAYRSKTGEGGLFFPGVRWEHRRINEIRGWSLHFKRVSEKRGLALITYEYRVVARKNGSCAGYRITDTMAHPPYNVQVKPSLVVEPRGVAACR